MCKAYIIHHQTNRIQRWRHILLQRLPSHHTAEPTTIGNHFGHKFNSNGFWSSNLHSYWSSLITALIDCRLQNKLHHRQHRLRHTMEEEEEEAVLEGMERMVLQMWRLKNRYKPLLSYVPLNMIVIIGYKISKESPRWPCSNLHRKFKLFIISNANVRFIYSLRQTHRCPAARQILHFLIFTKNLGNCMYIYILKIFRIRR